MGRIVYGALSGVSISSDATQDIWNLLAGTNKRISLHGWELTSAAVAAALCSVSLQRVTTAGTGGSAVTEQASDEDSGTIDSSMVTDVETPGTPDGVLMGYQWEQLGPVGHIWTPEMRPKSVDSQGFALVCNTAIAMTVSGWVCWEEH
ncbi:MAG: hypothetical protein JKY22_12020 [Flavobacteriaceae bacterium]|nr:hypothetical protein [Flavobacteriaceae bacterium]PCJ26476.1 MAG: hypothetical protein COA94_05045 [Rickettsiales bacterium]